MNYLFSILYKKNLSVEAYPKELQILTPGLEAKVKYRLNIVFCVGVLTCGKCRLIFLNGLILFFLIQTSNIEIRVNL